MTDEEILLFEMIHVRGHKIRPILDSELVFSLQSKGLIIASWMPDGKFVCSVTEVGRRWWKLRIGELGGVTYTGRMVI